PGGARRSTPSGHPTISWGIGDVVAAWFAGIAASVVVAGFGVDGETPAGLAVLLAVQNAGIIAWLAGVARLKGRGSLAADFGLVHFADPSIGTVRAFPGIVLLGLVSGYEAVTSGDLSRSIMLHIGFNGLSVVVLFSEGSSLLHGLR